MADTRKKTHHILLTTDGKHTALELFDAREWPDQSSNDGEYRVRIDGKWYSAAGKYTFLSYAAVGHMIACLLSGRDLPREEMPPVALKPPQRVHVHYGDCISSLPVCCTGGFVAAPPYRGIDGRWYVAVSTYNGVNVYPCHDVEAVKR